MDVPPLALQPPGVNLEKGPVEKARLKLEWPRRLRTGDRQTLRLALRLTTPGGSGKSNGGQQDGYNRLIEAHLELDGMLPDPDGEISAPIIPGESSVLEWTLHSRRDGIYGGTLWVHIRFIPQTGKTGTEEVRRVVTAQRVEFQSTRLLGLNGEQARLVGISGVIAGMMIFLETFLEGFWRR